jgi:formylglycine-generating enzyme required for sulfatase activity
MRRLLVFAALLVALPAGAVTIDWVPIGHAGNVADPDTNTDNCGAGRDQPCGAVPYEYYISKYEVTNAQYAEFLNAVAESDPFGLYNTQMGSQLLGGISRSGSPGSYSYAAKAGYENDPVNYVSFYDALRFANWLDNGQASGDTETGAYTLLGQSATPINTTVARNSGAIFFVPSESEWYKAAYYDAASASFFDYPTATDAQTSCVQPLFDNGNSANCWPAFSLAGNLTSVGAYGLSDSVYGTFDQGGNVWEWNEAIANGSERVYRGGAWSSLPDGLSASAWGGYDPASEYNYIGFRVASLVPEPGTALLVMTGLLGLAARRKRLA